MKVLLVGANGNLGLRLVAALLTHGHEVVACVRSSNKLEALLPASIYSRIAVVEGNATDTSSIRRAILENGCEAVVNTAGVAAMAPWKKNNLPEIFSAVLKGTQQAGSERGQPLRIWLLGGLGVLTFPGTETMLSNYVPIFLEHRQNIKLLKALPPNSVDWSLLCPSTMSAESLEVSVPAKSTHNRLTAKATSPPLWKDSWLKHIPFLGKVLLAAMNAPRYETTLEQNADFIASDLKDRGSRWIGVPVGVINV
ncbi:NAD(P)-binding protein [Aureobasidium sp. EXF-10728]|nr:NAD(P)-binding protein [Aureobasidium sp. EXF-10728]